jgi:hypothetical protein
LIKVTLSFIPVRQLPERAVGLSRTSLVFPTKHPKITKKNIIRAVRAIRMLKVIPLFIAALSLTLIALASKP